MKRTGFLSECSPRFHTACKKQIPQNSKHCTTEQKAPQSTRKSHPTPPNQSDLNDCPRTRPSTKVLSTHELATFRKTVGRVGNTFPVFQGQATSLEALHVMCSQFQCLTRRSPGTARIFRRRPTVARLIASKAFLDCALLTSLTLMPGKPINHLPHLGHDPLSLVHSPTPNQADAR